jgi:pyridoxamine 5'-phosphate oxidase
MSREAVARDGPLGVDPSMDARPVRIDAQFQAQLKRMTDSPSIVEDAWAVYVVRAREVEFWQGAADRRHLRLRYLQNQSEWSKALLWP